MRSLAGRLSGSFALAVAVAASCVVGTVIALALAPTPIVGYDYFLFSLDVVRAQALSAVGLILLATFLRRRQEATAYVLLTAAAFIAGWGTGAVWSNTFEAGSPIVGLGFLSMLSTVTAPTAILALFASTNPRRLAGWVPGLLAAVVVGTVVGVTIQSWNGSTGTYDVSDYNSLPGQFAGWFTSPLAVLIALAVATLGSIRNEALRFVPASPLGQRQRPFERAFVVAFVITLVVSAVMVAAWARDPTGEGDPRLLPMLAALVGIVAARWSPYVAWTALTVSLGVSAGGLLATAIEGAIRPIVENPDAPWRPTGEWVVQTGIVWLILGAAIGSGSAALRAARAAIPGRPSRTTPSVVLLTLLTLASIAWASLLRGLAVGNSGYAALEIAFWAATIAISVLAVLVLIGGLEAARGRLVPAIAEAESVARRPLRPFKYLETVVIEALTGRAALRRMATAAERSKLASDLHAELLPSLAEIAAQYEAGAPKEDVALRMRELEDEIRDLMAERRLVVLEEFGIVEAIEWLLGRAEERRTLEVELSVHDRTTSERPPREVERAAFRIAQLAVENALRHAAPKRLALDVLARPDEVRISISDDGQGFVAATDQPARDRFGIADMRSQAAEVRGDVQVDAPAAGGTTVTFAWPAI